MMFRIRKLCSATEEYDAMANGPINLDSLNVALSKHIGIEVVSCPPFLNILLEDQGVVVMLYSSGKALIRASTKEDAEQACRVLTKVIEENNDTNKTEIDASKLTQD